MFRHTPLEPSPCSLLEPFFSLLMSFFIFSNWSARFPMFFAIFNVSWWPSDSRMMVTKFSGPHFWWKSLYLYCNTAHGLKVAFQGHVKGVLGISICRLLAFWVKGKIKLCLSKGMKRTMKREIEQNKDDTVPSWSRVSHGKIFEKFHLPLVMNYMVSQWKLCWFLGDTNKEKNPWFIVKMNFCLVITELKFSAHEHHFCRLFCR